MRIVIHPQHPTFSFQAHLALESNSHFRLTPHWNRTPPSGSFRIGQFYGSTTSFRGWYPDSGLQMDQPESITDLLASRRSGDDSALHALVPILYKEMRRLAQFHLAGERPEHTLQATALVHEAYLRLAAHAGYNYGDRSRF